MSSPGRAPLSRYSHLVRRPMGTVLIIGGTGMLRGLAGPLASQGEHVALLGRSAGSLVPPSLIGPQVAGFSANWCVPGEVARAAREAERWGGPISSVIAWVHQDGEKACGEVAELLEPKARCTWWDLWGSGAGAPGCVPSPRVQPRDGLELRSIILGWVREASGSRWLSHPEIVTGVLQAIQSDHRRSIVGTLRPWSERPG